MATEKTTSTSTTTTVEVVEPEVETVTKEARKPQGDNDEQENTENSSKTTEKKACDSKAPSSFNKNAYGRAVDHSRKMRQDQKSSSSPLCATLLAFLLIIEM